MEKLQMRMFSRGSMKALTLSSSVAYFDESSPATTLSYEIVEVGGNNTLYSFSNGINLYWHLWWSQGDMNYQSIYYQYLSNDGILTMENLIAIAEIMSDINAVQGNMLKPYDDGAVYEQTLGLDVKEFLTTPAGWSFADVYAAAHPDCIPVIYNMQKEAGILSLHQCSSNTDKMFERYNIPANAIEQVEVGKNKGRYITGNVDFQGPEMPFGMSIYPTGPCAGRRTDGGTRSQTAATAFWFMERKI